MQIHNLTDTIVIIFNLLPKKIDNGLRCGMEYLSEIFIGLPVAPNFGVKKDKMADGSPRRRCVSHSHFSGANFCWEGKGHFGSSGEQIWKSI